MARARVPLLSTRLFLINKATSNTQIDLWTRQNKTNAINASVDYRESLLRASERAMCTLRIIIALNAAFKARIRASHENYKALHEVY